MDTGADRREVTGDCLEHSRAQCGQARGRPGTRAVRGRTVRYCPTLAKHRLNKKTFQNNLLSK